MFGLGKKKIVVASPFAGQVVPVTEVPDPVFAQRMLGDGFAVIPHEEAQVVEVCAPISGTLRKIFKTLHAFAIVGDDGAELLVHIGLETVELKGEGFTALVESGARVNAGQPIISVDMAAIRAGGRTPITPVVFTKNGQVSDVSITDSHPSVAGAKVATARFA